MNLRARISLAWHIVCRLPNRSALVNHAERELTNELALADPLNPRYWRARDLVDLVAVYEALGCGKGTVGGSWRVALNRLFDGLPLTPLTGADDEWEMLPQKEWPWSGCVTYRNTRCASVILVLDRSACWWSYRTVTARKDSGQLVTSYQPISFPYTVD